MQRTETDLSVEIDRGDARSLPVQLADAVRDLVDRGILLPGERIPATRPLALRWGVSRGTVVAAVEQLTAEGYLVGVTGSGTLVNPQLHTAHPAASRTRTRRRRDGNGGDAPCTIDLSPAGVSGAVDTRWRAAWREAAAVIPPTAPPPAGLAGLREELAAHLRRMRGVAADPQDLVVTTGARDGLGLVLGVIADRAGRALRVAVEDPGYPSLRRVPARMGAELVEVPVDDEGISVTALRRLRRTPDVVVVTPSHQYPLGHSMSAARRHQLLDWARASGSHLVEDDYDSELRYVGAPLPALASLDRQLDPDGSVVVTLGSFSRTISGDLGAGFVYLPRGLVAEVVRRRSDLGGLPSGVVQRGLAHYLGSGGLRRRIESMRRDHRRRRARLSERLIELDHARAICLDGGVHAVVEVEDRPGRDGRAAVREARIVESCAAQGIRVVPLSRYWAHGGRSVRYGIVLGHPPLDSPAEAALETVRQIVNQA